jgi:hypothetical protein
VWPGLDEGSPGLTTEDTKDTVEESSSITPFIGCDLRNAGTPFLSCIDHFAFFMLFAVTSKFQSHGRGSTKEALRFTTEDTKDTKEESPSINQFVGCDHHSAGTPFLSCIIHFVFFVLFVVSSRF